MRASTILLAAITVIVLGAAFEAARSMSVDSVEAWLDEILGAP